MTARVAQDKVNEMIEKYEDVDTTINFNLQIENSVAVGGKTDTRYTLVVYIYNLGEG
jgi:hypothetical protein